MEEDRLETNLGLLADQDLTPETEVVVKQPRRRFVGRRTEEQANKPDNDNNDVESSTTIQG
jgi:2-(3-amino-3-carboxypropyl)histidine synthase